MKEFIRKFFVSLKRRPQNIPLTALAVAFITYSFRLTSLSDTTVRIGAPNMGQCEFVAMLFSILAFVCFLQAFPKRQKVKVPMLVLLFLMLGLLVFADSVYLLRINQALTRDFNTVVIDEKTMYIAEARTTMTVHIILVGVCAVLLATLPIYAKLLKKINTSIEVEGNGDMDAIDISGEDE